MPASSAMARQKRARLLPVGTATSFSTRLATVAVLPILHLNGYKIANPCFLARIPKDELQKFFEGMGYKPYFVEGSDPEAVHQQFAGVLDSVVDRDQADLGRRARERRRETSRLADDRVPHTQGLDLPAGNRRQEVRRLLAQPSGANGRYGEARPYPASLKSG